MPNGQRVDVESLAVVIPDLIGKHVLRCAEGCLVKVTVVVVTDNEGGMRVSSAEIGRVPVNSAGVADVFTVRTRAFRKRLMEQLILVPLLFLTNFGFRLLYFAPDTPKSIFLYLLQNLVRS